MARPPLEVADLVRAAGDAFIERNRQWLRWKHIRPAICTWSSHCPVGWLRWCCRIRRSSTVCCSAPVRKPKIFAAWLRPLYRQDWVVYLKRPFGGPEYVLHYLGRYTHRVAISNHRLVSFTDGQVTFRWRDSAHHNEQKLLPLSLDEFLCRFLLHILPKAFVRIRNFGFLANRKRATLLPLCFQFLGSGTTAANRTTRFRHRRLPRFLALP
jgi:hypothetical protein